MNPDIPLRGAFDYSPMEEVAPIWINDHLCTLFGEVPPPDEKHVISLRLVHHKFFGTGGHPASKAAIIAMLNLRHLATVAGVELSFEELPMMPEPFLEVGDTTGLLALVAATAGAETTIHASQEIESAALAEDNGKLNGHEIQVLPTILALEAHDKRNFYGCIATMRGGDSWVKAVTPWFWGCLAPGGWLIYAGHTADEHQALKARLQEWFIVRRVDDFCGWPVLVCQKDK